MIKQKIEPLFRSSKIKINIVLFALIYNLAI